MKNIEYISKISGINKKFIPINIEFMTVVKIESSLDSKEELKRKNIELKSYNFSTANKLFPSEPISLIFNPEKIIK
jgi:hypothetical protein